MSQEKIYQSLSLQGKCVTKESTGCLRTGWAYRRPKTKRGPSGKRQIVDSVMISERLAELQDRVVPGHWEDDLLRKNVRQLSAPWWNVTPVIRCSLSLGRVLARECHWFTFLDGGTGSLDLGGGNCYRCDDLVDQRLAQPISENDHVPYKMMGAGTKCWPSYQGGNR